MKQQHWNWMRTEELTCIKSYFLYKESRIFFNFFKEKHLIVEHKCVLSKESKYVYERSGCSNEGGDFAAFYARHTT